MSYLLDTNIVSAHLRRPSGLVHDLTLVTNNTKDFQNIPGLRLED
jgi:predicted nucleic acid-binding protein